jgi:HTH-type transcriptional regulator/antitoxin HigA
MVEKMNGLSLDFIIHPGETIKEVLEEKQMNQEELAIRTGFSPKHVSEVVNGKKGISPSFAKSLEYVLGIPTSFWINLQGIYDKEILEYKEQEEIDESEVEIVKGLKNLIKYAEELNIMSKTRDVISQIIELRNICNVKNLTYINNLVTSQVAFRKSQAIETNIYVLYVWLRICEIIAQKNNIEKEYDEQKLKDNIVNIKKSMFLEINDALEELKKIFAECGIIFQVVKNFTGAPVQGFIKKNDNKIILSMTIRRAFADEFWFTLFHEIGHLLNGDIVSKQFIDYADSKSDMEDKADEFARKTLINEEAYNAFISKNKLTEEEIIKFANEQEVKPFIVVGRIQKEKNDFKIFYNLKIRYKWK